MGLIRAAPNYAAPMSHEIDCPFCTLPKERVVAEDKLILVIRDGFPISPGHTLIIPRRHVSSFFDLNEEERETMFSHLERAKVDLDSAYRPDGYNIGVNDGRAAGQTVMHLHMHLIPRYLGDRPDPRGGVRWIIPEKADYWSDRR